MISIVKAEVLWSRTCPLNCHYCSMVNGRRNTPTINYWKSVIDSLVKLNCQFVSIYGAEPLTEFNKLPQFIQYLSQKSISSTVITTGCVPDIENKLKVLYESGLRSLTTSYDIVALDKSSGAKSSKSLYLLETFKSFGPVDNIAICITLTKKNYMYALSTAKQMSARGIWTFFDLIHPDRSQPGSKVKGSDSELLFSKEDIPHLRIQLQELQEFRKNGGLLHASNHFYSVLLAFSNDDIVNYRWKCNKDAVFPSWVTIDCDGKVYPCDDFHTKSCAIDIETLVNNPEFVATLWNNEITNNCPGCFWNTHIDAHGIKMGNVNISEYVHKY